MSEQNTDVLMKEGHHPRCHSIQYGGHCDCDYERALRENSATQAGPIGHIAPKHIKHALASAEPGCVAVPVELVKFLLGESDLEGIWFGEEKPGVNGRFWWRLNLRAAMRGHHLVYNKKTRTIDKAAAPGGKGE